MKIDDLTVSMAALANLVASTMTEKELRRTIIALNLLRDNLQAIWAQHLILKEFEG